MVVPHFLSSFVVEWRIVYLKVDARLESLVEMPNAVRSEEENALIVVERAKED